MRPTYARPFTYAVEPQEGIPSYEIDDAKKTYKYQYSNIYYMRLQLLRSFVQTRAKARWKDVAGSSPRSQTAAIVCLTRTVDREPAALCRTGAGGQQRGAVLHYRDDLHGDAIKT